MSAPAAPRITFVSSHATLGGSELYLERLVAGLGPDWVCEVVLLQEGLFADRLREQGLPVRVLSTGRRWGLLAGALGLARTLRKTRPAVVHANGVKAALVAVLATRVVRVPVVWVKHDFSWDGHLTHIVARGCRKVIGVSEGVLESMPPRARVIVIPTGVPQPAVDRDRARALVQELAGGEPVVALIGRLDPGKGQLELVAAAPRVLARLPGARFLLVGGADPNHAAYSERVRRRTADLGLDGVVTLTGHRHDADVLIAGCDAIALPSSADRRGFGAEGFGLVGVEALASGTPVVGYATGALPEVLGDGALLVASRDRVALADALLDVLSRPELAEELRGRGRERYRARYRFATMVEAMREQYRAAAQ
jgi:glycosyltransferase involved in cell wall biosynthesis